MTGVLTGPTEGGTCSATGAWHALSCEDREATLVLTSPTTGMFVSTRSILQYFCSHSQNVGSFLILPLSSTRIYTTSLSRNDARGGQHVYHHMEWRRSGPNRTSRVALLNCWR
jgi:hypothetical protein